MAYIYEPRQFILDFRRGYVAALEYTYTLYNKPLHYFIQAKCKDEELASSIVAESFLRLYSRRQHFESLDQIKRWLYIVAKNQFVDVWRKKNQMPIVGNIIYDHYSEYEKPHAYEFMNNMGGGGSGDEIEMLKSLILERMYEDIESLPRQRRIILKLYFFKEKTTAEIMKITGLSQQTVLNHKTRAIAQLKYKFLQQGITHAF